jgi:hypothetical protein
MSKNPDNPPNVVTTGGIAAKHPPAVVHDVLVGPSTNGEFNTVELDFAPEACVRFDDVRFEFDSSFIGPEAKTELKLLGKLIKEGPERPASIFGHADPVGDDDYNKILSGRRSQAMYGLLTRKTELWEDLFKHPQGGDSWGTQSIQVMLKTLGHYSGPINDTLDTPTRDAVKAFQGSPEGAGLTADGDPGQNTRPKLYKAYMDRICVDDTDQPFQLDPAKNFLAQGADAGGKGDFQGCSEFNPDLVFSQEETNKFKNPANKAERDQENKPNRRVVIYLFRKGSKISPASWPCPRAKEGVAACRKRFFSDGEKRRTPAASRRLFKDTKDTFACRFYDRISTLSPCEGPPPPPPPPPPIDVVAPLIIFDDELVKAGAGQSLALAPSVKPQSSIVVVKKPYTNPKRTPVTLKTDKSFTGTGTFTVSQAVKDAVEFFKQPTGGSKITFTNKDNEFPGAQLQVGVKVFAAAVKPSAGLDDVVLTLALSGGTQVKLPPAVAKLTAVELTLDICQSRTTDGVDPTPLPQPTTPTKPATGVVNDKLFGGRPVHVQDTGNRKRAMLIVRKAQPAAFKGTLVLSPINAKVQAFPIEGGGSALSNAHEITNNLISTSGEKFFAQGKTVSGTLNDTGFRLGIKGLEAECDKVGVTVFKINKIEAKLRGTPCLRDKSRAETMPAKTSTKDHEIFDATAITIVRECGDLKLTADVTPSSVVASWAVKRAADDAAALTGLPTHKADGINKRLLTADATGSFHFSAFVDCNGNAAKRDTDEDGLTLNLNIVNIEVLPGAANNQIITRNNLFRDTRSSAANLFVDSGSTQGIAPGVNASYTDAEFLRHPLAMKVTVKITGGGANQRRGVDKVGLGFIQQTPSDSVTGTYADGRTLREVITQNPAAPDPITTGNPPLLPFPVRDTRGSSVSGTGPFIISSTDRDITAIAAGGEQRVCRYVDPPAIILKRRHPVTNSALSSISGSNDFVAFLSAFSSDFNENYTVVATGAWSITYGTFSAAAGWTTAGARVTAAAAMTVPAKPQRGETTNVERCLPNFLNVLKMDAR